MQVNAVFAICDCQKNYSLFTVHIMFWSGLHLSLSYLFFVIFCRRNIKSKVFPVFCFWWIIHLFPFALIYLRLNFNILLRIFFNFSRFSETFITYWKHLLPLFLRSVMAFFFFIHPGEFLYDNPGFKRILKYL